MVVADVTEEWQVQYILRSASLNAFCTLYEATDCGAQTWDAYTRWERTSVRYRVRRTEMVLILIVDRQIYPRDLVAWAHLIPGKRDHIISHVIAK